MPAIFLAAMFALNVYRAVTQSFVIDEQYSYELYVGHEPFSLFRYYNANLHLVHTLLGWVSVQVFGLSELSLRLPSLAGCALYFAGVHRLSGIAFSDSWRRLLAVVLLTANPLIQDHMSVGRGYGLALAFFAWAFCDAVSRPARLPRLAVLLALSVASNLVFLFPALALIAMASGLSIWRREATISTIVQELAGPWLVLTFLILVMPFSRMEPNDFYYGLTDLADAVRILVGHSIGGQVSATLAVSAASALAVAGSLTAFVMGGWRLRVATTDTFAVLAGGTLVLTAVAVIAAHVLFGVLYPFARTGIYLLFLLPLCLLPLARWKSGAILLLALSATMAQGIRIDRYREWDFDANARQIAEEIVARHPSAAGPVRVACFFPVCRAVRLYTVMWNVPGEVEEVTSWEPGFDYYVFPEDAPPEDGTLGLGVIYRSPVSKAALAAPRGADAP